MSLLPTSTFSVHFCLLGVFADALLHVFSVHTVQCNSLAGVVPRTSRWIENNYRQWKRNVSRAMSVSLGPKLVICLPSAWGNAWLFRVRSTRDIPRKSQAFPEVDGRHSLLFKVRGTGLAVYFPCLPARCGQAWVFLPARCGKAWLFLYLTLLSIYNGGLTLSR